MNRTQPFFQLEKKQGWLRLTLGASFGRTLIALATFRRKMERSDQRQSSVSRHIWYRNIYY
jgi:hypothetical protein